MSLKKIVVYRSLKCYCSNVHEDNFEIIDLIVLLKFLLKFNKCIIYVVVCLFVK